MVEVKVENYKVGVTIYQLTSLSFHVNRPSHSWDTAFSKFDLENARPRSWVRWILKATCVQHYIDSDPFCSMSICHPIPEIRLFQNLTMKIQGEGYGWGPSWKSQSGCNILSIHNYRPRQFHRTLNHENPSSGYRDMGSASLAATRPNCDNTPPARRTEG